MFNIGDTVYQYDTEGNIYGCKITGIIGNRIYQTDSVDFDERAVGHSIFVSISDAQKAFEATQRVYEAFTQGSRALY